MKNDFTVGDLLYIDISPDDCGGIIVQRIPETMNEVNHYKDIINNGRCVLKNVIKKEQLLNVLNNKKEEINGFKNLYLLTNKQLKEYKKMYETLQQQNKQLKDNWNKLKEYFKYEIEYDKRWYIPESEVYTQQKHYPDDTLDGFQYALDKMQELESDDSNE